MDAVTRAQNQIGNTPLYDALVYLRYLASTAIADSQIKLANTLWVAKDGDDATAIRGRLDQPYLTVQAAVNAAMPGDTIYVMPGVYVENVAVPAAANIAIVGASPSGANAGPTVIVGTLPGAAITWPSGTGALSLSKIDLAINGAAPSLVVSGSGAFSTLVLEDVFATMFTIGKVVTVDITDLRAPVSASSINDCSNVTWRGGKVADLTLGYDQATATGIVRGSYEITGVSTAALTMTGHPAISFEPSCFVDGVTTGTFSTFFSGPNDFVPIIEFAARTSNDVGVTFGLHQPAQAATNTFDASRASIPGELSVKMTAFDAHRSIGRAHAASIDSVVAGESVDLDIRGTTVPQSLMSVTVGSTGTLDRDTHVVATGDIPAFAPGATTTVFFTGAGGSPLPFPAFPPGPVPYGVSYITADPLKQLGLGTKTNFGFDIITAPMGGTTADLTVTRQ